MITMADVQRGYDDWAAQPHNKKWVRLIDGTPIPNDIVSRIFSALSLPLPVQEKHTDDLAVDRFAAAMKAKLAKKRSDGRGGWDNPGECSIAFLSELLREHVAKGDPVDVGNLAMMIHQRGGMIE